MTLPTSQKRLIPGRGAVPKDDIMPPRKKQLGTHRRSQRWSAGCQTLWRLIVACGRTTSSRRFRRKRSFAIRICMQPPIAARWRSERSSCLGLYKTITNPGGLQPQASLAKSAYSRASATPCTDQFRKVHGLGSTLFGLQTVSSPSA